MQPAVEAGEGSDYSGKLGGTTSTGEYVTVLAELFDRATRAEFKVVDTDLLRGRRTIVYEFTVTKELSKETIKAACAGNQAITVGYRGKLWVDRENNRVLRFEEIVTEIPAGFPVTAASRLIDYDWASISDRPYLLPSQARILLTDKCTKQTIQTRNDILFRGYRKFGSELKIIDIDDKDFVPDEPEKTNPPDTPVKSGKP